MEGRLIRGAQQGHLKELGPSPYDQSQIGPERRLC